ncbi:DUF5996 family protein [Rhodococcus sp. NPDC004095]
MTDRHPSEPAWPSLRVEDWTATRDTLHMWTQIVGKIRLALSPMINHWWQVTLYVSARGLSTGAIPYGTRVLDIEFDFVDHLLRMRTSDGGLAEVALEPKSVSEFYFQTIRALSGMGVEVHIRATPNEVETAIPFADDEVHTSYDAESATLFWRQLVQADRVIREFRSYFTGKVTPVHFFWGAMDLACTRFSGRPAPKHPGGAPNCGDWVMVEGYSHELSSCGFWPGGGQEGAFYSYAYPAPDGFDSAVVPEGAFYSEQFRQFLFPYERARSAPDPDAAVGEFLHSTYAAAADLGGWDRAALECDPHRWSSHR